MIRASPKDNPRYCLRCQAELDPEALDDPRCRICDLQYDPGNPDTYHARRVFRVLQYILPGFFLAVPFGISSYALVALSGDMGWALFFGVPVCVGAILGYTVRTKIIAQILLLLTAVACIVMSLVAMDLSGILCGLIGAAVFLVPAGVGLLAGGILRHHLKRTRWSQRSFLPLLVITTIPFVILAAEKLLPRADDVATVTTVMFLEAPRSVTWDSIVFYEEVQHEPPLILRLALPKPIRSEGSKSRVGDVVRCLYDRGYLVKRLTAVEEGRRLAFEVIEQKLHFERDVTLLDGSFELRRVAATDGAARTRLSLRTRYRRHLYPKWLWEPIERVVVRSLHEHVLKGMEVEARKRGVGAPLPANDLAANVRH